jgi:hypothetical protein
VGKHHSHAAKHFLSIKKETWIEYYVAGKSDSFLSKTK